MIKMTWPIALREEWNELVARCINLGPQMARNTISEEIVRITYDSGRTPTDLWNEVAQTEAQYQPETQGI